VLGVSIETRLQAGQSGFDSQQGCGIFFFTTAFRPALGPTQPLIQWVRGGHLIGVKRPRREADLTFICCRN